MTHNRFFCCGIFIIAFILQFGGHELYAQNVWQSAYKTLRATQIIPGDGSTLFAIGGDNHFWLSTDLGQNFQPGSNDIGVSAFVIGPSGRHYLSSQAGLSYNYNPTMDTSTWFSIPVYNLPDSISALFVRSASDGSGGDELWAGTMRGLWYRKLADTIWINKDSSVTGVPIQQITAFGNNIYYHTATDVFVSNDNGSKWTKKTQTKFGNITAILAPSALDFFMTVTAGSGIVFHSTNSGVSFDAGITFGTRTIEALTANTAGDIFMGGTDSSNVIPQAYVLQLLHGTSKWTEFSAGLPASPPSSAVISLGMSANQTLLAGTDSQGVWRTVSRTKVNSQISQQGIELQQNYPNPANVSSTFSIYADHPVKAKIVVLDAIGRNLMQLIDGELHQGTTNFTLDTKNLPNGTYFYRLQTNEAQLTRSFIVQR